MISKQILNGVALFAFSLGLCLSPRSAAGDGTQYWDIPTGGPSGPWDLTHLFWSPDVGGGSLTTWLNGSNAIFSATNISATGNFTVTLTANVTVGDLTYTRGSLGSTLQIAAGMGTNSITMASATMNVTVDPLTTLIVAPKIVGVGGSLVLQGGTLVLTGANTYAGGTTISSGTLQLGNANATSSIVGAVVNNDTFDIFNANTAGITTITNSGGTTNFLNTSIAGNAAIANDFGTTNFLNASSAGNALIITNGGGFTQFFDASTAGNAAITTNDGGFTEFFDTSTAENAALTNNSGGEAEFNNTSSAGHATIANNTGVTNFNDTSTAGHAAIANNNNGITNFNNTSTAGNAAIANNGGITNFNNTSTAGHAAIANNDTGVTNFNDTSTAGDAAIVNNNNGTTNFNSTSTAGGAAIANLGGITNFNGASTAGDAAIANGGGVTIITGTHTPSPAIPSNNNGLTIFSNGSTAGNAAIINNAHGETEFFNASIADNATIITNSGGLVLFFDASTGGQARFITNAGGTFNISNLTSSGMTAGSIEGAGAYFLGSKALTIGLNNLSTEVSGIIADGGVLPGGSDLFIASGTGGSLIKVGTGTLTLTGANTYSGGTSFNGGILAVNGDANLGTGGLSFNGGALEALAGGGGISSSKSITLNAPGGMFLADAGTVSNLSGAISGAGSLTKNGLGALVLTAANTYSGGTSFNGGILAVNGDANLGTGGLSFNGGALEALAGGGGISSSKSITLNAPGGMFLADAGTVSNLSGAISGAGSLTKNGLGALVLTASNTYSGGTSFNGGILAVNGDANLGTGGLSFNGGALQALAGGGGISSSKSITLNVPGGMFLADVGTVSNLSGAISGAGSLTKNGLGALVLTAANTYSGGTVLNAGTLTVHGPQALGLGNVVVNGGILNADPQPINVKGNYTQNAGGTLQLQVAGAGPGQYDSLNVGGNAALGGTLQLVSLGFQPKAGNQLTLVSSGGVVSGRFAQFIDPFVPGAGFTIAGLVYGQNSVLLEFRTAASFALTPNQLAAATLLDAVHQDSRAANLISFLNEEPFANLPGDFEKISPDGLTAIYEISFSNANIQLLNLEDRLDDIRNGSNGFASNMKVNGASVNLQDRADADGKSSKNVVEPILQHAPENRWGVWVTGFGDFVNVDGDGNAQGYNFTTGGVSLGIDYRITDQLAIGVMGDYSHTWTSLNPSGHIDVDSGRGGVYATWFNHGIYLNGAIYGGHNNYDSSRASLGGLASGSTEGSEFSTFIGGGYDFHFGPLIVGPIASLQYTDVGVDSFGEKGSLALLDVHSGSAESLRSDVGFRTFYQWQIGKILVEPSLKAAWEHEYKYSALPITAGFAGIPGPSATFFGPSEGHDSAVVSAGVSVQLTSAITTYVNYDGQLGRENYDSNAVTGGVRISF